MLFFPTRPKMLIPKYEKEKEFSLSVLTTEKSWVLLNSLQEFIEIEAWLLASFCLQNQISPRNFIDTC